MHNSVPVALGYKRREGCTLYIRSVTRYYFVKRWSISRTGWPVIHGRVFLVLCKTCLVQCTLLFRIAYTIRHFFLGTIYNNTAMFNVYLAQEIIMAEGKNIMWKSNTICPIIFGLLERISSGEKGKGTEISGNKINN